MLRVLIVDDEHLARQAMRRLLAAHPEDGCVGGFVQRGTAAAADEVSVIEMGGSTTESQATRATEASVRGFWKVYRRYMGY